MTQNPVSPLNPLPPLDPDSMPVQALVQLGRCLGQPITNPLPGGEPFLLVPKGYELKDISAHAPPTHIHTKVTLTEPAAFVAYVNRFKTPNTLLFATVTDTSATLLAVLDYHGQPAHEGNPAARCAHTATFTCQPTNEWNRWNAANGKKFDQCGFATWLEEHQDLIINPPGAVLLELVQNLEGKNHVRFNSAVRLQSGGSTLSFDEDVELQGRMNTEAGKMVIPSLIQAGIAPFQGLGKYQVDARLKYKIESRKLTLWFETVAPHRIVRDAVAGVLEQVAAQTGIQPLAGSVAI